MSIDCSLKSLTSPGSNEILQSHNSLTFKLLKTVADFSQAFATLHDKFGHELQMLVETFRKRNGELRKERLHCPNSLFQIWELFLQQVEVNSQQHGDISRNLGQKIGNGLIERVFHRKIQSKKTFAHRDRIETILMKSNELLLKCYRDYCQAYALALTNPAQYMSEYIASHNVYVHQLQATNGMIHAYQTKTLPKMLEELEECHLETSQSISSSLLESSELVSEKSNEQASGYQLIANACKQANHRQDLAHFVKVAAQSANSAPGNETQATNGAGSSQTGAVAGGQQPNQPSNLDDNSSSTTTCDKSIRFHQFQAPSLHQADLFASGQQFDPKNMQLVPKFKNEIAPDLSQPPAQQQPQLEKDRDQLADKIEKTEERIEALNKLLARSTESHLHNKTNEIQEELCQRRFDLLVAQIHLSAVRAQLQLFEYNSYRPAGQGGEPTAEQGGDSAQGALVLSRKTSSGPSAHHQPLGYRNKWIKAFKSLKESPAPSSSGDSSLKYADEQRASDSGQEQQSLQGQSGGQQENQHFFQEYTFKKIASCDVCKDFLRGHMRQGVKCKLCKISCHNDCQSKAHSTIKCQQPKIKLLRRQKSASELEVNNSDTDALGDQERTVSSSKPDSIYQLIRQVLEAKKKGQHSHPPAAHADQHHLSATGYPYSGPLAQNQMMNLSTGNLALSNQNGKSVSTSALGGPAASVDRWAVVMDLLAESRGSKGDQNPDGSGKRHSKQLDKFKLAAKSAAAVSKHQRHHLQQQQQQQQQREQPKVKQLSPTSQQQRDEQDYSTSGLQPIGSSNSNPLGSQYGQLVGHEGYLGLPSLGGMQMGADVQQPLHGLQHTKSLPVGHQQQQQQLQTIMLQPADGPSRLGRPGPSTAQQPQPQQQPLPYQLLNVGAQQLQSTSAPHSPQRKRFNLRMKSFSLDSPESPSVVQPNAGYPSGQQHNSGGNLPDLPQPDHQLIHLQQHRQHLSQQQHPQLHYESSYPNAIYQSPVYAADYADQQQASYQLQGYQQFEPPDSYLARGARSGRHSSPASQQYPEHRHSYHNPSYHYQRQQDERLALAGRQGGSQSALNSGGRLLADQQQQQQQTIKGGQDSTVINGAAQSNKSGNSIATNSSSNNNNNNKHPSNDNVSLATAACETPDDYYDLGLDVAALRSANSQQQHQQQPPPPPPHQQPHQHQHQQHQQHQQAPVASGTLVVLYDYVAQRVDEIQLNAGQLVALLDASERDWWKVRTLDQMGPPRCGYFPASYLAQLYQNERPLQVAQTIQVSNGETCDKLLRGQIVIHTGKQVDNFVTIRLVVSESPDHYIQCPEKYLMEVVGP